MRKFIILITLSLIVIQVAAISSLAVEDPYSAYIRLLQNRIRDAVVYPHQAGQENLEGMVKLSLRISGDGRLKDVFLRKSSGHKLLDEAARDSVLRASPYPPIPEELDLSEISLDVPIVYTNARGKTARGEILHRLQRSELKKELESKILSLEECIEIGLANYKPTQVAWEQVRLAQLKVRQARRNLYPTLAGEWKATEGETITDPYESLSYGFQLEQTFYDGGKLKYTLRQEELGLEIAKKNHQKVRNELIFKITEAYYSLIGSKMLLSNQKDLLKEAKSDLDLARRLYEAQLITEAEFLNVQSLYHRVEFQLNSFENDFSLVKLTLRQLLDIDDQVRVKDSLDSEVGEIELTLDECVSIALDKRPEVGINEIALISARYGKTIAQREGWPRFSLVTSYGRSGEAYGFQELALADEWSMMGKLSWFFGGSSLEYTETEEKVVAEEIASTALKTESTTHGLKFSLWDKDVLAALSRKKEAEVIYQGSLGEITKIRHTVRSEVEKAYLDLRKALAGIEVARRSVEFRRKELAVIEARRNLDELPLSNLLETRMQLRGEKARYIQSLINYYLARAGLNQATAYAVLI